MSAPLDTLVYALKSALGNVEPLPLYRGAKQEGLFASRTGPAGEAAQQALRDGLLEIVRKEARGKSEVEWVRITPLGVQFVQQHESPRAALEELVPLLRANQQGLPRWVEEFRAQLHALTNRFTESWQRQERQLEQLLQRAEAALERLRAGGPQAPLDAWQLAVLEYLRRRRESAATPCPIVELFNAARGHHPDLTLGVLHEGLAQMRDRGAVDLVPFGGHLSDLPEPEYALLEGPAVYSAVRLSGRDNHSP